MTAPIEKPAATSGLEGVVAAETRISHVDGENGRLVLAGYDVESLAGRVSFEQVFSLLYEGILPPKMPDDLRARLAEGRAAAFEMVPRFAKAIEAADAMDALRGSMAQLPSNTKDIAVAAAVAVFTAAWIRMQSGEALVPPDLKLDHATDYLRMATGEAPSPIAAAALGTYLVTVSDHSLNASTFTARVIASTNSDTVSAVVGAIGALKGPLHGGAPGPVLDMIDAVGSPERARGWLEAELAAGRRIMGMGHRIYRVRDPRAAVFEKEVEKLERAGLRTARLGLARAIERTAEELLRQKYPARALRANVEFYTAVLLDAVGLPRTAFTPTFAVGRVVGWLAHIREQRESGRLIRPSARYIGVLPRNDVAAHR
jgi:citrate synthase